MTGAAGGPSTRPGATVPLFPLRTVLFPGGVLPLRVFEQRYIDMTRACLRQSRPFGVVMISAGDEVATDRAPASFADVGTLARIVSVDLHESGVLHVAGEGLGRFRVLRHRVEKNRLVVADVADLPAEPKVALPADAAPLARLLELMAARVDPHRFPSPPAFDDASWVGYRLAEFLPLPLPIKQTMLEVNDATVRLAALSKFLAQQRVI
ncbi:MAG: LON peptidase substrate-binding domain-containing protein [Burkholderiales bacterium]